MFKLTAGSLFSIRGEQVVRGAAEGAEGVQRGGGSGVTFIALEIPERRL